MQIDESHSACICARAPWNDTGIDLSRGQKYRLAATGQWFDRNIETGPCGYTRNSILFRLAAPRRRQPDANWFALIGSIGATRENQFLIACGCDYLPVQDGRLYCFANDVRIAYCNNSGHIQLTVTRIA